MINAILSAVTSLRVAALGVCALLLVVSSRQPVVVERAAAPQDVPSRPQDLPPRPEPDRARERLRSITDKEIEREWPDAKQFLWKHAHNRYMRIEEIPGGPPDVVKRRVIASWRATMALQHESPTLFLTRVHEIEVDDEVLGICLRLKRGVGDRQKLRDDLREKIKQLVELGISERQQRIGLVETALKDQKEKLDHDQNRVDEIVAERFKIISTEGVEGARFGRSATGPHSLGSAEEEKETAAP